MGVSWRVGRYSDGPSVGVRGGAEKGANLGQRRQGREGQGGRGGRAVQSTRGGALGCMKGRGGALGALEGLISAVCGRPGTPPPTANIG